MSDEILLQHFEALRKEIVTTRETTELQFKEVYNRLDKIEARLSQVEIRLSKLESRVDKIEVRLGLLEDETYKIKARLENMETQLYKTNDIMGQIDFTLDAFITKVDDHNQRWQKWQENNRQFHTEMGTLHLAVASGRF